MKTNDYTISQAVRNIAILEPKRQVAASVVCRRVINPIQGPVLAAPVGACVIENVRVVEPAKHAVSQVRPWVRYLARMTDLWIFSIMVGIAIGIYFPSLLNVPSVVLTMGILFVWVFQESILLTNCGTTPGKWLFKITVRDSRGRKLSFSDALNRSFSVLLKGMGAGIPIISLISLLGSRSKLKRDGITTWDEEGGYIVTHEKIGVARAIITTVIIGVFLCLIASA